MQAVAPVIGFFFVLLLYAAGAWVVWKFYTAIARIGEELSEIKTVLRLRLPPPASPADP